MKRIEYTKTFDRKNWRAGVWDNEPDKVQWPDKATGLPCLIKRNPFMGNLCGYVGVPPEHPWYGKNYDDVEVDVHGGLSYAGSCSDGPPDQSICHVTEPGEPDHVWWFGFDCGHAFDASPGLLAMDVSHKLPLQEVGTYRDWSYVEQQVGLLAEQLAKAAAPDSKREQP
jgi:hypothetical protein